MSRRIGFVTQLGMNWQETLPAAAEMDFEYVELMMDGIHERTALDPNTDDVRSLADAHDLSILVHLPFRVDIGSPFEHVRRGSCREIKAALDTASDLGAEKAVLHASSDAWEPAWDEEDVQAIILDSIRELDQYAAAQDVEICVENVPTPWFGLEEFPWVFDETDASMTLDTGHAYMEGYDSATQREFVTEYADRISHVHVNDTRKKADEHLPVGSGFLDFETILEPLSTVTLSIEVFTDSFEYVEISASFLRDALGE